MSGLPIVTVKLDDGTGTFPYNITQFVDMRAGISIVRGRTDRFSDVGGSTATLVLNNKNGDFTVGVGVTYQPKVNQGIRIQWTIGGVTYDRFTGYVQAWPIDWPNGQELQSNVTIQCVDWLGMVARRTLMSEYAESILVAGATCYWPLFETEGATSSVNYSLDAQTDLVMLGTGTPVTYGTGTTTGDVDQTPATFVNGGQWLRGTGTYSAGQVSVGCGIQTSSALAQDILTLTGDTHQMVLKMNTTGQVLCTLQNLSTGTTTSVTATTPIVNTGSEHYIAVTQDNTQTILVVDGTSYTMATGATASYTQIDVGNGPNVNSWIGTISNVWLAPLVVSSFTIINWWSFGLDPFVGWSTLDVDSRLAQWVAFAGRTLSSPDASVTTRTAYANVNGIAGKSLAEACALLARTEGGLVYCDGSGNIKFKNRKRQGFATSVMTVLREALGASTQMTVDNAEIINDSTVTTTGMTDQRSRNKASILDNQWYSESVDVYLPATALAGLATSNTYGINQARERANWDTNVYGNPWPRFPDVPIDVLSSAQADQKNLMTLDLWSRFGLNSVPAQAPSWLTDLVVQGWTETIDMTSWNLIVNATAYAQTALWILQDANQGFIDGLWRIGY
jgi:hypothetical protein